MTTATRTATASSSMQRLNDRGLINQGWKDSWDGINFADGSSGRAADRAVRGAGLRLRRVSGPLLDSLRRR